MTSATDTDIREIKDLIAAGNAATQKQIADLAISTQKQITDSAIGTQKQIADLREEMQIGFTKIEGQINTVGFLLMFDRIKVALLMRSIAVTQQI